MNILSYIIVNLFLFFSWYIFLFRKRELISFVDRIIGTSVLALSQIILSALLLGVPFKKLYATSLFTLNIFIIPLPEGTKSVDIEAKFRFLYEKGEEAIWNSVTKKIEF